MAAKKKRRRRSKKTAAAHPADSSLAGGARESASRVPRVVLRASVAALVALVVATAGWLFFVYPRSRGPGGGRAVEIEVPAGLGPRELAALLADAGVLGHPGVFSLWLRLTGGTGSVVPGKHLVTDDASPQELAARLERRGGAATARVTFPEGWTRFDMAKRLQDRHVVTLRSFLEATTDTDLLGELGIEGDSAEGFLFPATYDLPLDSDGRDVVRRMKHEFDRRWDLLSRSHGSSLTD
ncbi:MAG: endolytic transglycosylase MltG, partial [Polyangiaceae bacterium]